LPLARLKSHVVQHFPRQRITVFIATIILGAHARSHDLSNAIPAVGLLLLSIAAAVTRLASI
jgi:hypothetical protein